jgi:hypothetical protein
LTRRAGAAAAWVDTVEKLGSGKLTVAEVLEPAIRLAEEGFVNRNFCSTPPSLLTTSLDGRVPVSEIHSLSASPAFVRVNQVSDFSTVAALGNVNTKCVTEWR